MAFSEVLADVSNHGKYSLSLYDVGRFMRLDAAAQRALNVMKTKFDANDNFSLYGLMSRARTSMGKRLLKVGPQVVLFLEILHQSANCCYFTAQLSDYQPIEIHSCQHWHGTAPSQAQLELPCLNAVHAFIAIGAVVQDMS